ncbi:RidA family protein [Agrobacterium rhizogenes]|uniref:RidA family protein n=1 Tax=Rhizobium rhizogenes TaxID=359 RepID=UPI0022B74AC8|nr:RidA family protein [Rhizobium rhizogenes]MCZ7450882.1 RidA family protein [Rhizobium rhizogenes]
MSPLENGYPYSSIRRAAGLLFLSGEVALDDNGNVPEGVAAQTRLVMERIERALKCEGVSLAHIVSATVHLTNAADFEAFNEEYARILKAPFPARTTVCASLVDDVLIEVSVIAVEALQA